MSILAILWPIVGLIGFIAYIWLVVLAFRQSALWGLGVLFLSPFAAIFFAIKYWEDSKKPFIVYSSSVAFGLLFMVLLLGQLGGAMVEMADAMENGEFSEEQAADFMSSQMQRMQESGMLDEAEQEELRKMQEVLAQMQGEVPAEPVARSLPPAPEKRREKTLAESLPPGLMPTKRSLQLDNDSIYAAGATDVPDGYRAIGYGDAKDFVGELIRVVGTDGLVNRGTLEEAGRGRIVLERRVSAGTLSMEYRPSEIRSIQVAYR